MARLTGGQLVAKSLKALGVTHIFSLTGGQIASIYDATLDAGIKIIDTRHEQAAGFMADAWGRLGAYPGVCLVSAGPAFTNVLTALGTAREAASPVVFLSGSAPLAKRDKGAFQELEQLSLARPLAKWARQVTQPHRLGEYLVLAFREARSGRPGPVYLDLPEDVLEAEVKEEEGVSRRDLPLARSGADPLGVAQAAKVLMEARRPLLLAGSGVWYAQAWPELTRLAEMLRLLTFTANLGRGTLPDHHPLCLGPALYYPGSAFYQALGATDLLVIAGHRFNSWELLSARARGLKIDIHPAEAVRGKVEISLAADLKLALAGIASRIGTRPRTKQDSSWLQSLIRIREKEKQELTPGRRGKKYIHPFRLAQILDGWMRADAVLVADGGDTSFWARAARRVGEPGLFLDAGPWKTLGCGLPFALAAKVKHPERQVVLLTGDGSLGFSLMEFRTAVKHDIPALVVVNNDKAWGLIKHGQEMKYGKGRAIGAELGLVRYDLLARDMGGFGRLVTREEEIEPALRAAHNSGKPSCLNVVTDPGVASPAVMRWSPKGVEQDSS